MAPLLRVIAARAAIIDKTALYVARNGPEFEAMILKNNAENPKFSFLKPGDPFHAHYRKMVIYNGGAAAAAPPPAQSAGGDVAMADAGGAGGKGVIASSGQTAKPSTVGPRVVPLALPEQQYRVPRPAGLLPEEVETVMLAAQFTARNGRRFLAQLAEREGNNPRFDFLRPQHHLFGFFTALVDAYSKVLLPPQEVLDNLKANAMPDARPPLLSRLRQHAEWLLVEEKKRLDKQNADDAERMQQLSIDWHDFVVVETISFDDDDDEELPAAARLDPSAQPPAAQAAGARAQEPAAQPDGPQPAEPAELDLVDLGASVPEPAMVVRKDYKPQLQPQAKARAAAVEMAIDPISGKEVPLSQIGEHLRISLLDPRWKEQKQAAADKNKESNVASGSEVFKNIAAFAQRRTDIFGDEEGAIGELLERERREKEKAAKDRVIWDGTSESIVRAATLAQTQASAVSEQAEHEAEAPSERRGGPALPAPLRCAAPPAVRRAAPPNRPSCPLTPHSYVPSRPAPAPRPSAALRSRPGQHGTRHRPLPRHAAAAAATTAAARRPATSAAAAAAAHAPADAGHATACSASCAASIWRASARGAASVRAACRPAATVALRPGASAAARLWAAAAGWAAATHAAARLRPARPAAHAGRPSGGWRRRGRGRAGGQAAAH